MATEPTIEVTMFPEPSGNIRGIVVCFMQINCQQKRIAHANLLVGESSHITLSVPAKLSLDLIAVLADDLKAFAAKVQELDSKS